MVDLAVTLGITLLTYVGISAIAFVIRPRAFEWPDPGPLLLAAVYFVLLIVYLTFSWSASGRSLGDQVMGLRVLVVGEDTTLRSARAFLRAVVCAVFPLGLLWCAVDRKRRALHDLLFVTHVVYDWIPRGGAA
jgi:uncharacterized RDD family membrane protein YckC